MTEYKPVKRSKPCSMCNGKGKISVDHESRGKFEMVLCPACKAHGTLCNECGAKLTDDEINKRYKACDSCRMSAQGLL